jgi:hypothetical protein
MKENKPVSSESVRNASRRLKKFGVPLHTEIRMIMAAAKIEEGPL